MNAFEKLLELRDETIKRLEAETLPPLVIPTKRELTKLRNEERQERARLMAELTTPEVLKDLEEKGLHVTDLLPQPEWIIRPYQGDFDLTME